MASRGRVHREIFRATRSRPSSSHSLSATGTRRLRRACPLSASDQAGASSSWEQCVGPELARGLSMLGVVSNDLAATEVGPTRNFIGSLVVYTASGTELGSSDFTREFTAPVDT